MSDSVLPCYIEIPACRLQPINWKLKTQTMFWSTIINHSTQCSNRKRLGACCYSSSTRIGWESYWYQWPQWQQHIHVYINTAFTWWSESKGDLHLYASGAFDITYNGLTGMWTDHVNAPCRPRGDWTNIEFNDF